MSAASTTSILGMTFVVLHDAPVAREDVARTDLDAVTALGHRRGLLIDGFGRRIDYVRVTLTDACVSASRATRSASSRRAVSCVTGHENWKSIWTRRVSELEQSVTSFGYGLIQNDNIAAQDPNESVKV